MRPDTPPLLPFAPKEMIAMLYTKPTLPSDWYASDVALYALFTDVHPRLASGETTWAQIIDALPMQTAHLLLEYLRAIVVTHHSSRNRLAFLVHTGAISIWAGFMAVPRYREARSTYLVPQIPHAWVSAYGRLQSSNNGR
jgi:hypothetical protein